MANIKIKTQNFTFRYIKEADASVTIYPNSNINTESYGVLHIEARQIEELINGLIDLQHDIKKSSFNGVIR